jgi:hypothetical protein
LNIAKSRVRPSICNRVRIDQTCFGRSGGFWPMSLPLFQGSRRAFLGHRSRLKLHGRPPGLVRRDQDAGRRTGLPPNEQGTSRFDALLSCAC